MATGVIGLLFLHEGMNRRNFEDVRDMIDPSLNLLTWRINWQVFFALPALLLSSVAIAKALMRP